MNALTLAIACGTALWFGYRWYGRWVVRRAFGAGDFEDARLPSQARKDGVDFVPTRRSVLFGHHYVTIAGAGPIVGPAVAVTWGWLPALAWVVLGAIFIGAVHDVGALIASIRNGGRTIGDLAGDIMTPRVRMLFLAFIFLALWIVLAVFGFVIAGLFAQQPASVPAVWIEIPLALLVGYMVHRRGRSIAFWSLLALVTMYAFIAIGMRPAVSGLFTFEEPASGVVFWIVALFVYAYFASVRPVTQLLQPRDYINSHQLFLALGLLLFGLLAAPLADPGKLELVAPAINRDLPDKALMLYPFLFITIACGAISGFHCMVASGTTSRQLSTERDAHAIGYGAMILEGALAVIVILCCVSAAGFGESEWAAHYSESWVGGQGLIGRIQGFIHGGAGFIAAGFSLLGLEGAGLDAFLRTVITVVIISFAATTMDSATRIQRYVVTEIGSAVGSRRLAGKRLATLIAVGSAAALAIFVQAPGKGLGSGGMVLWPIFGVTNQLLACLTFLVLTTWLAKRGRPLLFTLLPLLFLVVTVSWAAVWQISLFADAGSWHLVSILAIGLVLEGWMLFEGWQALRLAHRVRRAQRAGEMTAAEARFALGGAIGEDGVIRPG